MEKQKIKIESAIYTLAKVVEKEFAFNIPIYQRLYVWKNEQIKKLLEDMELAFYERQANYYLGAVMLRYNEATREYDLIDGQQRFTTLWIIMHVLDHREFTYIHREKHFLPSPRLRFAARNFADLYFKNPESLIDADESEQLRPFKECRKIIEKFFNEQTIEAKTRYPNGFSREAFGEYIYRHVNFLITTMPEKTDVNKLFEVLNNRGIQLQQHEILKATLLRFIPGKERSSWALVWDICSIMENYIEKNFKDMANIPWKTVTENKGTGSSIDEEEQETGEEDEKKGIPDEIKDIFNILQQHSQKKVPLKLIDILKEEITGNNISGDEEENREDKNTDYDAGEVRSIISFPMFLLHTLRVFLYTHGFIRNKEEIPQVKEKELIKIFHTFLPVLNEELVKDFFRMLWKIRVRFDEHIVKWVKNADHQEEDLMIKKLYYNKKSSSFQRRVPLRINSDGGFTLLQAMLYHSQQLTTHYWLTPLFGKLLTCNDKNELYTYLRRLDNRMFCSGNEKALSPRSFSLLNEEHLHIDNKEFIPHVEKVLRSHIGVGFPGYWFYKTDFILWFLYYQEPEREEFRQAKRIEEWENYKMTAKNSVEHISAQKEKEEETNKLWMDGEMLTEEQKKQRKDDFGNLVLLTSGINSEYSNKTYREKQVLFEEKKRLDSLKSSLIFQYKEWNRKTCQEHREQIIHLFTEYLTWKAIREPDQKENEPV